MENKRIIKQILGLLAGVAVSFLSTYLIFNTYRVILGVLAITTLLGITCSGALVGALLSKDERIGFLTGMLSAALGMPSAFALALRPPTQFYLQYLPLLVFFGFVAGSVGFIFVRFRVREGYTHAKGVGLLAGSTLPLLLWIIYKYMHRNWIFGSYFTFLTFVFPIISSVTAALISRNWKITLTSAIIYGLFTFPIAHFVLAYGITRYWLDPWGGVFGILTGLLGGAAGIITAKLLNKLEK